MARILVAGATGYLGRFVVKELHRRGHRVRALGRSAEKLADLRAEVDGVFVGEVTRPDTLAGVCDGIEIVFSSIGITRQKDGLTYADVDLRGNLELLDRASAAGVRRFVYVASLGAAEMRELAIIDAKERFVEALNGAAIESVVIRPDGYFSDVLEFLRMAERGRVYLFGDGSFRMNPIHGQDLARFCGDAIEAGVPGTELDVGGPVVYTHREIAQAAFAALGRRAKITCVPVFAGKALVALLRLVAPVRVRGPVEFTVTVLTRDMVGPRFGEITVEEFFREQASRPGRDSHTPVGEDRRSR